MFVDFRSQPGHEIYKTFEADARVLCLSLWTLLDPTLQPEFVELNAAKGFTVNLGLPQVPTR